MQTHLRRGLATLATGALVAAGLSIAAPAQAAPATDAFPARSAAEWLIGNLNDDNLLESHSEWEGEVFSGPSYGTSVDFAEGLSRVGGHADTVASITDAIAANLAAYTTDFEDGIYSGSSAKALALLAGQGRDVTDLQVQVESSVITAAGAAQGRLQDSDPTPADWWADWANSIGQAYAARALTHLGSDLADEVTGYLLDQQCSAGFFRLYFPAVDAADQTCDGASPAVPAEQSPDTTAIAVIQLAPLTAENPAVDAAVTRAVDWLKAQQAADGSFVDPVNGANANTTGLVGWALTERGESDAAARAAAWLRARQVVGACAPKPLAGEHGAVAYDDQGWADGVRYGITDKLDRSQWVIADVQALPALLSAPAAGAARDSVSLPKFAKAGTKVTATLRGVAPGERACVRGAAGSQELVGTGSAIKVTIAKAKAGNRAVTLRTASGIVRDSVRVLGKKKLTVKAPKRAKAGTRKKVTVRGLVAGEKVSVRVRGKKVSQGRANAKGVFVKKVKVGKSRGQAKVVATGQYGTRKGAVKITVR